MSGKKPNLTIQIQQPGDEFNSKFQGYVEYHEYSSNTLEHQPIPESQSQIRYPDPSRARAADGDIRGSRVSQRSNASNASQRSAILERAQQLLLEERLEQNMKSLSRNKVKNLGMSRNPVRKSNHGESRSRQSRYAIKKSPQEQPIIKSIPRSKSASLLSAEQSRAKVLQQIAQKLKKLQKVKKEDLVIETKSQVHSQVNSRVVSQENSDSHSRVERIKEIKEQMSKARGGKLQHLLKDIKKSNKEAYKVVYTIKKSNKNGSPFEKSLQMRDRIHEQSKKTVTNTLATNLFNLDKTDSLKKLVDELQHVRMELKQVKNKNEQLLHISQQRSANTSYAVYNLDSASQSSRITRQIQTIEFDQGSNGSHQRPNSPSSNPTPPPRFTKGQTKNSSLYTVNNSYQIIEQPNMVQPCFACGCTCRSRVNMAK